MIPRVKVNYSWRELARALAHFTNPSRTSKQQLAASLAALFKVPDVLLTPSGRGGLYFLLRALPQPRVLVPAYTCKAAVEAAMLAGKRVSFIEVEGSGFNCGADELAASLDAQTIFIATHQFGIPCDIEAMVHLCRERGAVLVEDCAASLGTRVGGRLTGTFGDAAFFSFDSTKLINVPLKAGVVLTREAALLARVREIYDAEIEQMPLVHQLRLLALGAAYPLLEIPALYSLYHRCTLRERFTADSAEVKSERTEFYRYDITPWQAEIAAAQLARLDATIARRREIFSSYLRALAGCHSFVLPPADERGEWACIRFPILVAGDKLRWYRAAVARGVDFAFSFTFLASPPEFARSHALASAILDLPFYEKLSDPELHRTVETLRALDATFATPEAAHV